jgi:glycosyltransferase involved in cell wall biosynthesis
MTGKTHASRAALPRPEEVEAQRILVILPALNESAGIANVIRKVRRELPGADMLVVDDGSIDGTAEVARREGAIVARLPFNLGVGGAMRTGFRYAREHGYHVAIQVDGDGQHDPADIPALLTELASFDVVIGSRFASSSLYAVSPPRRQAMRVLAALLSSIMGTSITDATSGFRAHGRRAIHVYSQHYPVEYLGDTLETLVIARKAGLAVGEVPVCMRPRAHGRASQGVLSSSRYLARAVTTVMLGLVRKWPIHGKMPA